jgi:plastocyanin
MPEIIPRHVGGAPLNVVDPFEDQEFREFGCPPNSQKMVEDLQNPQAVESRAHRLFDPSLVAGWIEGDPLPTPDRVDPDITFENQGLREPGTPLFVPGVGPIEIWSFRDRTFDGEIDPEPDRTIWPARTIRVREGQIVHSLMNSRRDMHTIHHHGIEPTPANDGVGHLTFDVQHLHYDYQWKAADAGTYFYHCHVNTTLHFEMGMYGMLIVDPDVPGAPFSDGGPGAVYRANHIVPYAKEAIWVADDIDRRWHANADHGHEGHSGVFCDHFVKIDSDHNPRLHDFNPDVFVVTGVPAHHVNGLTPDNFLIDADEEVSLVTPRVKRGGKLLVRAFNASYTTTRWKFPTSLSGEVISADGRTFGRGSYGQYSNPYSLASVGHQIELTTAQRQSILIDTSLAALGNHHVEIGYYHWITNNLIKRIRVRIIVDA